MIHENTHHAKSSPSMSADPKIWLVFLTHPKWQLVLFVVICCIHKRIIGRLLLWPVTIIIAQEFPFLNDILCHTTVFYILKVNLNWNENYETVTSHNSNFSNFISIPIIFHKRFLPLLLNNFVSGIVCADDNGARVHILLDWAT